MITTKVDRIMEAKLKAGMHQVAVKALIDLLPTGQADAGNSLKDTSFTFIENNTTEMLLKETLDGLFAHNLERWTQAQTFMNALRKGSLTRVHSPVSSQPSLRRG